MNNDTSKGITPVIAIVLLLLITVGAVGTVYSQFQGLLQEPDTGFLEDAEIEFQSVTRNGSSPGQMQIRLQNQGDDQYNLTEISRLEYSVPGEQTLEFGSAELLSGITKNSSVRNCMLQNASTGIQEFRPETTATCNTGVDMVDPNDQVTIYLKDQENGEEIASYTCSPSTSTSSTC